MSDNIKENDIIRLAKLARVDLRGQEEKILKDAERILAYFEELKEVDISGVSAITGATDMVNIASDDNVRQELIKKGVNHFPELENGCLKVPGVMNDTKRE